MLCATIGVRLLVFCSSSRTCADLYEKAFRHLGGSMRIVILDNLREGVLTPDRFVTLFVGMPYLPHLQPDNILSTWLS